MEELDEKSKGLLDRAKALYGKQVENIIRQEQKLVELLQNVLKKISKVGDNPKVRKFVQPVMIFVRMIQAHFSGEYRVSYTTLVLIVLALVYFLSPVDFIPDFLGFFGFADDLTVVMTVFAKVKDEVEGFLDWERTHV